MQRIGNFTVDREIALFVGFKHLNCVVYQIHFILCGVHSQPTSGQYEWTDCLGDRWNAEFLASVPASPNGGILFAIVRQHGASAAIPVVVLLDSA